MTPYAGRRASLVLALIFGAGLAAATTHCGGDDSGDGSGAGGAIATDGGTSIDGGTTDATGDGVSDAGVTTDAPGHDGETDGGACAPVTTTTLDDTDGALLHVLGAPGGDTLADPSIYYPPGAPGGALAYSSVPLDDGGAANQAGIATRVALSNDQGGTWSYVATVNAPEAVAPPAGLCPDAGACTDHIVNETPSILYDPSDAVDRQWKLFTHRYQVVTVAGEPTPRLLYTVGHIAMYTAKLPSGPWSSPEVAVGWPGAAFSSSGAKYLTTSDPSTAACGALAEPGATVAPDGSLHLALGCIQEPFDDPTIDLVVLRSTDHGATWSYLATPLRGEDGACFGGAGKRVNAVDLFTLGTTEYLMATPEAPNARAGCVVFPFSDPSVGALARTQSGALAATRLLTLAFAPTELAHYAGACTYGEGAPKTGFTMSHLVIEAGKPAKMRELASGVTAP